MSARRRAALLLVLAAAVSFILGIQLPLVELNRFFIFSDTYSLLGMVQTLYAEEEWLLAGIILVFSVLLPGLKILLLGAMAVFGPSRRTAGRLHSAASLLGRWSMLDVLLVAILILAVKTSGVGSALSQPGLYFFTGAIAATMLAAALLGRR